MSLIEPGAVILVTGASGSIGYEIAAQAAAAGAVVGVHGSRPDTVDKTLARLKARTAEATLIAAPGDFRQPGSVAAVVEAVAEAGGKLDAVIHCAMAGAGANTAGAFEQTDPANYGQLAATILGVFEQLCFAALPHLGRQGGTIVGFASDAGRFAATRQSVLGGVYGGVMSFTRNLALEVAPRGVRVHCLSPSFVEDTRIFERFVQSGTRAGSARDRAGLGLPTPQDIAPMALFLCGPGARRITGQVISINGGLNA